LGTVQAEKFNTCPRQRAEYSNSLTENNESKKKNNNKNKKNQYLNFNEKTYSERISDHL